MTVDEQIGTALKDVAGTITPRPDPYGRVYARLRRSRRRRRTSVGLAVVALVAGAIVVPRIDSGPAPTDTWNLAVAWTERMTDGPVRGSLGGDESLLAGVQQGVLARMREGIYSAEASGPPREYRDAKIVFAGDVGTQRFVMVALELARPDHDGYPDDTLWLSSPAGSDAPTIVASAPTFMLGRGLAPLQVGHLPGAAVDAGIQVTVAVVPHGCEIATSTRPQDGDWQAEPTGSYLVRTPQNFRGEWWRVTCDGSVTAETPSKAVRVWPTPSAADVTAWTRFARGRTDLVTAELYTNGRYLFGAEASADPSLLWAGRLSGSLYGDYPEQDGTALVMSAPIVGGGWKVAVSYTGDPKSGGGGLAREDALFEIDYDPAAPGVLLPLRMRAESHEAVVVAPAGAVRVRAVTAAGEVAGGRVAVGAVQLTVPDPAAVGYEALDASGKVIARAVLAPLSGSGRPVIDNWGFPQPFPAATP